MRKRLLDYETFAKRNSLKFTLGRLRTVFTNSRQEIRFSCNSDLLAISYCTCEIRNRILQQTNHGHDDDLHNVSVMTLIPRLEEEMFKHHMKKYQAALNCLRWVSNNGGWLLLSFFLNRLLAPTKFGTRLSEEHDLGHYFRY